MEIMDLFLEFSKWGSGLLLVAAVKLLWDMNQKVASMLNTISRHDNDIIELKTNYETLKQSTVSKSELQDTLTKIGLMIENMILKQDRNDHKGV